jgi:circadian clock protein KaiC
VTSLTDPAGLETSDIGISSLIDTWFQVRDIELAGERTRGLYLVKSRGMGHSNQVREFVISSKGVELVPVAVGPAGVLTGSARLNMESDQRADAAAAKHELERRRRQVARKQQLLEQQIAAMRAEILAEQEDVDAFASEASERVRRQIDQRARTSASRSGNGARS